MNIEEIEAAQSRISGAVRRTPLLSSPFLDKIAGRRVLFKAECLQHTGSFKFRGAMSALSALNPVVRQRGVVAFSSGNHAQGVALAARRFDVPAVIIMPSDAPATKIANTRDLGAEVVLYSRGSEDRDVTAKRLSAERGLTLIPPFDDAAVIAGQGTCGLEIAEQAALAGVAEAEVLVCCGGGGLSAGTALALEAKAPGMRVRPIEPEGYDDVARSLRSGRREHNVNRAGGLCDAVLTPSPGELTFPILKRLSGPGIVVGDDEALHAMALAFSRLKLVAEPGGALGLAAALFHNNSLESDTAIVIITGGNVDAPVFSRALSGDFG